MTPSDSAASSAAAGAPTAPADTFVAPEFAASAESGTACAAAWKPIFEWVPSQKGFFVDAPQRQSTVLACVGMTFPLVSCNSIVPVTTYGPFGRVSIVTSAMQSSLVRSMSLLFVSSIERNIADEGRIGEAITDAPNERNGTAK